MTHWCLYRIAVFVSVCLVTDSLTAGEKPAAWTDPEIPVTDGLALWFDAAGENSVRQSLGIDPLSHGDRVSVWHDGSGNDRHLTQWVTSARPQWQKNDSIYFSGGQFLSGFLAEELEIGDATLIIVADRDGSGGDFPALFSMAAIGGPDYSSGLVLDFGRHPDPDNLIETVNVEGAGQVGDAQGNLLTGPVSADAGHIFTVLSQAGSSSRLRVDGQPQGSRPRERVPASMHRLAVGARFVEPSMRHFLSGRIAEILFYERLLTPEEMTRCEAWLMKKHRDFLTPPDPNSPTEIVLEMVATPPAVQMLVPGFRVDELPIDTTNLNNIEYAPDGRLYAAGYDGRLHLIEDSDGDQLEDRINTFSSETTDDYPIGLVIRDGMPHTVLSDEIIRFRDTDNDGIPDRRESVVAGWDDPELRQHPILMHRRVDSAMALASGDDGSWYVTMGSASPANGYWQQPGDGNQWNPNTPKLGTPLYTTDKLRGCLLRIHPDGSVERLCSGLRYIMSLQWDRHGELFATEQEGATWLPNGNPFDELLHLQTGRHYGFPPRHPRLLPDVIDEPSVWNFAPQHQSPCGFRFNGPSENRDRFGPEFWAHDALTVGASRGKLWRTSLSKTPAGYIAQTRLIAALNMLAIDCAISPGGDLVICCHSGPPDWGTGPSGRGKLFKIRHLDVATPQPVAVYAPSPTTTVISFDAPLPQAPSPRQISIQGGRFISAGDRFESFRPGYEVVRFQQSQPRFQYPVRDVNLSQDRRNLTLTTAPRTTAFPYSVTIDTKRPEPGIPQSPGIDLDANLHGLEAHWVGDDGSEWHGWIPHPDPTVIRDLTRGTSFQDEILKLFRKPGRLTLRSGLALRNMLQPAVQPGSELDYPPQPETVFISAESSNSLTLVSPQADVSAIDRNSAQMKRTVDSDDFTDIEISLRTPTNALSVTFHTDTDTRKRPMDIERFHMPFAVPLNGQEGMNRVIPEIVGGEWTKGKDLFFGKAACATCHTIHGEGQSVGPDLSNSQHRDYASVLKDITDPNASINPDAIAYMFEIHDEPSLLIGIRTGESDTHLQITSPGGIISTIEKERIRSTEALTTSLMPAGLLDSFTRNEIRDLMTFLLESEPRN